MTTTTKTASRRFARSLTAALALSLLPMAAPAQQHLRFATAQAPDSIIMRCCYQPWIDALNEGSNGTLDVAPYPPPFAAADNMWDRVTAGVADIGNMITYATGLPFQRTAVASLPGLASNAEAASAALWRLYEQGMLDDTFEEVHVLGLYTPMALSLYSRTPVQSLDDLAGMRVRSTGRETSAALEALGASPVSISFSEAYQAISRGVVDGAVGNGNSLVVFRFNEMLEYEVDNVSFGLSVIAFIMNRDSYANLEPEARASIDAWSGERLSRHLGREQDVLRAQFNDQLIEAGTLHQYSLPDEERALWLERLAPITETWLAETDNGQAVYDAFVAEYTAILAEIEAAAN
ncbi:TRAP transporter substrate-binding protein DctP [Pararhodobacter sp.]|uniref:TRAP transporter substrate-binding protein DctP n=1 Tax=Pararhodobacter sp. TaxID=2127056 RepID=UPI002AFE862C|nr:TRAP transporter substrate-binding protein DctP [Pararhodobacter sp.]